MDFQKQIISALLELKNASLTMQKDMSDKTYRNLTEYYGLAFLGGDRNHIMSKDLFGTLTQKFGINIDQETFNHMIPEICSSLGMSAEPMRNIKDIKKPDATKEDYLIILN